MIRSERNEIQPFQNNRIKWIMDLICFVLFKICRFVWQHRSFTWKGEQSTTILIRSKMTQRNYKY